MSTIGLNRGLWMHYNPMGVMIYNSMASTGFIIYRLLFFVIIGGLFYFIITKGTKIQRVLTQIPMIWIYISAIVWDLYTLGYPQLYNLVPDWLIEAHYWILEMVFKLIGII